MGSGSVSATESTSEVDRSASEGVATGEGGAGGVVDWRVDAVLAGLRSSGWGAVGGWSLPLRNSSATVPKEIIRRRRVLSHRRKPPWPEEAVRW